MHPASPMQRIRDKQDITKLNDSELVEGLLRKNIQGVPASFIFVGSRRSLLLQMFSDQKRFLTLSANKEFLPPLPEELRRPATLQDCHT